MKELIASTEIEGARKATLLKHLKSQLEKTKNEVASEQSGILEASVSKEEEKKVLRRQVSNLIDQVSWGNVSFYVHNIYMMDGYR